MAKPARRTSPTDWKLLLPKAAKIVNSYDTSVTLRQLFYRLVALGPAAGLPNTTNAYKSLSYHTAKGRRDGTFPDLIDRVRSIHFSWFYTDLSDALEQTAASYRLDRTIGQQYSIYLCIEKAGILEQLESWFDEYGFPMLALGGYCSQSHVDEVVQHVRDRGRPAILIGAGDFDASGEDIFRDFVERTDCWEQVRQVALNEEQIERYDLPVNSGKEHDTRLKAFNARHREFIARYNQRMGTKLDSVQVELDALRPEDLRELFQTEIAKWWDKSAYDAVMRREERDGALFSKLVKRFIKNKE